MKLRLGSRFTLVFLSACLVGACSSKNTSSSSSSGGTADAGSTLPDFTVYAVSPGVTLEAPLTGIAGVSAFLEMASGQSVEGISDAEGKIVFHGVDFEPGPVS